MNTINYYFDVFKIFLKIFLKILAITTVIILGIIGILIIITYFVSLFKKIDNFYIQTFILVQIPFVFVAYIKTKEQLNSIKESCKL